MTDSVAALKATYEKTTPGTWIVRNIDDENFMNVYYVGIGYETDLGEKSESVIALTLLQSPRYADNDHFEANAEFIVAAHQHTSALLAEVERMKKALSDIQAAVYSSQNSGEPINPYWLEYRVQKGLTGEG